MSTELLIPVQHAHKVLLMKLVDRLSDTRYQAESESRDQFLARTRSNAKKIAKLRHELYSTGFSHQTVVEIVRDVVKDKEQRQIILSEPLQF